MYTIRKGSDRVAIDERGVTFKEGSKVEALSFIMMGKSAEEIERLGGAGGFVLRQSVKSSQAGVDSRPLFGEYVGNLNNNEIKGGVIGSIRVQTKNGIVTIPIEEIVEFGEKK